MNKRIKKKFITKHGYKRYRSEIYRYIRSWMRASSRYTILGIPDPDQMKYSKDHFTPYEGDATPYTSETGPGMVSGFIEHLKETDPSKVPPICGTERYSGPTEFEEIIRGKLDSNETMDCVTPYREND